MTVQNTAPHPTVAELVELERKGNGAAKLVGAMSNETLAELDDRLTLAISQMQEARFEHPRFPDLVSLATRVRYTLRHRRARANLDALLAWSPR